MSDEGNRPIFARFLRHRSESRFAPLDTSTSSAGDRLADGLG